MNAAFAPDGANTQHRQSGSHLSGEPLRLGAMKEVYSYDRQQFAAELLIEAKLMYVCI
jgi:hypothetical protein